MSFLSVQMVRCWLSWLVCQSYRLSEFIEALRRLGMPDHRVQSGFIGLPYSVANILRNIRPDHRQHDHHPLDLRLFRDLLAEILEERLPEQLVARHDSTCFRHCYFSQTSK